MVFIEKWSLYRGQKSIAKELWGPGLHREVVFVQGLKAKELSGEWCLQRGGLVSEYMVVFKSTGSTVAHKLQCCYTDQTTRGALISGQGCILCCKTHFRGHSSSGPWGDLTDCVVLQCHTCKLNCYTIKILKTSLGGPCRSVSIESALSHESYCTSSKGSSSLSLKVTQPDCCFLASKITSS